MSSVIALSTVVSYAKGCVRTDGAGSADDERRKFLLVVASTRGHSYDRFFSGLSADLLNATGNVQPFELFFTNSIKAKQLKFLWV